MEELQDELLKDLRAELADCIRCDSDVALLAIKIKNAVREVKRRRNYQKHHDKVFIDQDILQFYSVVHNLALYDWNLIGAEGESSHSENGISRSYTGREEYLSAVIPFVTVL